MALTKDILKANAALAQLTDEQISAIVTLSTNDETTVIGARIGELHGQYDQDILSITGVAKKQGEKTYDYNKRVLAEFKEKAGSVSTLEQTIQTLTREKSDLEKQITDGTGDKTLKQKLTDTEKLLNDTKLLLETEKNERIREKTESDKSLMQAHTDFEFNSAVAGMKFKSTIPENVREILIKNAKAEILAKATPDFVEENGKRSIVFRDAEGNILNNKGNQLKPFTATELISDSLKDIIDDGRKQSGTGTHNRQNQQNEALDLSAAKTQVEADDMITSHLMSTGLTRQNPEFATKQAEIRTEAGVDKLPMR